MAAARLLLSAISKVFPGVKALDAVSFDLLPAEIHALCGENGAGKSTLMNILSGNLQPDEGEIFLHGEKVVLANPLSAQNQGISIVHQEKSLVGNLSIAENIFTENYPVKTGGFIDFPELYSRTQKLLQTLNITSLDPRTKVESLSSTRQQIVEIAKALAKNPKILILDEPTAAMTADETETLFRILRELRQKGTSVIYISHRLTEIFEIADRLTVLRDGKYQGTFPVADMTIKSIIRLMVGRDLEEQTYTSQQQKNILLSIKNLCGHKFHNITFELRAGEILALAGLVGAGRSEVARAIMGIDPAEKGEIWVQGKKVIIRNPPDAIRYGIGYVPENRKEQGIFPEMTLADNIAVTSLSSLARKGFIQNNQVFSPVQKLVEKLQIKTPSIQQKMINLSGGNQQKALLGRWLMLDPSVLIVDEPTQGVDVGAKAEIYQLLRALAAKGTAILLISSELPEVLALSDRVLVLYNGTLTGELSREEATESEILHYASGLARHSP
ncbi:MAG: sugar ABC transporter ATP-binding protein [Bacteroidia bacterium]|nr:sugar ABC transporter ATP-binding protein [Bacteroidia bacterium]